MLASESEFEVNPRLLEKKTSREPTDTHIPNAHPVVSVRFVYEAFFTWSELVDTLE